MLFVLLAACQRYETYTNSSLGFTIDHPQYWEPGEAKSGEGIGFQAKDQGDAGIWIRVFDEVSAPTAQESLQIQVSDWLEQEEIEPLTEMIIATHERSIYDVASAQFTVPSSNTMFNIDFFNIVIQTSDRMAVIFIGGDGLEPEKAGEAIINSFEFLPR